MAAWYAPPFLRSILAEADRIAPGRSHASDGTIGDATHAASESDHNPDESGCVHAVDVTNDPGNGFDAWAEGQGIARRIQGGHETRIKYLVAFDGDKDMIFNPSVAMWWRQNGRTPKADHASHLHVSILYTVVAETSTAPLFRPNLPAPTPSVPTEDSMSTIVWNGTLHAFWVQGDGYVGHRYHNGTKWAPTDWPLPASLGKVDPHAVLDTVNHANQLHVFARTLQGSAIHAWTDGKTWGHETL